MVKTSFVILTIYYHNFLVVSILFRNFLKLFSC
nr:MAG TPA: hypothetical protein [Caudoviricetes sp.]